MRQTVQTVTDIRPQSTTRGIIWSVRQNGGMSCGDCFPWMKPTTLMVGEELSVVRVFPSLFIYKFYFRSIVIDHPARRHFAVVMLIG